ncbi:MAG: methionine--tRNA ligase [Myxococcota bacterium]|nr:methionine--tRNA ligase [Myxococcota bacterium]
MSGTFYATTPIYYVNAEPHIGHTYTTCVVDTLVRYHQLAGERTFFLTGTDEHGEKVAETAAAAGVTPKQAADRYSGSFRSAWDTLGFSFDRFIRTTDPDHKRVVQDVLQRVYDAGQIDFREYQGLYCVGCERFLTERDMVDGKCRDHEREPEPRDESNYFFRMSDHFAWLAETLEATPEMIRPTRYRNEVLGMLRDESGLGDLCISRPKSRLEWGIELPFDENYVCYVWFDALINYLTGIGYPDGPDFESYWGAAEHFIGKDILKPHAVFWPCMLRALGLPPYRHLNVHGYWNVDDRKVSKSLGNMISPLAMQERYGFEAFRYFLLRDMAFGVDADFSESAMVTRVNADLANNVGNLLSRTLNMTARYAGGVVPEPASPGAREQEVADAAARAAEQVDVHLRGLELHRALEAVMGLADTVNRYLEERAPWKVAKEQPAGWEADVATTLHTSCQALHSVALLLAPFLPESAPVIFERLGVPDALATARLPDDAARWGAVAPGTATVKGGPLFPRLELEAPDADS